MTTLKVLALCGYGLLVLFVASLALSFYHWYTGLYSDGGWLLALYVGLLLVGSGGVLLPLWLYVDHKLAPYRQQERLRRALIAQQLLSLWQQRGEQ